MTKTVIGVISDTHGLLRPEALEALCGCDAILHAGDIGSIEVAEALKQIAPLHIVRGNVDCVPWALVFPPTEAVQIAGKYFYILHNIDELDIDPVDGGFDAVIFGHSHRQHSEVKNGVLYFNPASAGPRRFSLPISLGKIVVEGDELKPEFIDLGGEVA